MDVADYNDLIDAIYTTLREVSTVPQQGSALTQAQNQAQFDCELAKAKNVRFNELIDDDAFWQTIHVIPFYGGVRPPRDSKIQAAKAVLADYRRLAEPGWIDTPEAQAYITDKKSYWNKLKSKGPAIIKAAAKLRHKQQKGGSSLIDIVVPVEYRNWNPAVLPHIWQNMRSELGFGPITTFHVMMELGIPVVKPDRMLTRTVVRLGLISQFNTNKGIVPIDLRINSEEALKLGQTPGFVWALQPVMQATAQASGKSVREVDWLFAKMGMSATIEEGREVVICDDKPRCSICMAHRFCSYGQNFHPLAEPPVHSA